MTPEQKRLFDGCELGEVTLQALRASFAGQLEDAAFLEAELEQAERGASAGSYDDAVQLVLSSESAHVDLKNRLLVAPGHRRHQALARDLQRLRHPSSVPFVRQALAMGFDHLDYTGSDPEVIAKWYSWLLFDIGTPDAIAVLREYARGDDPVADEMRYRLSKLDR